MHPKVSMIILNYNGKKHTLECLKSLKKISYKNSEIILFDNGSSDGTAEAVKKKFPKVRVIVQKNNIGYCGGTNTAYKHAKGKYVLLLNNDTIVTRNFLSILVNKLENNLNYGVVQPKLIFQKTKKLQSGCTFFTLTGFLYYFGYGKNPKEHRYNIPHKLYTVNGACMLVRRSMIEKIGLFDQDFFLYFEETDFCHRALLSGYDIWYEPSATVYHIGSVDNSKYKYSALIYSATKNRIQSYLKNLGLVQILLVLPIHIVICVVSMLAYMVTGKPESAVSVLRALFYNVKFFPRTVHKRIYIQKNLRRLPDSAFLPQVTRNPRPEYYLRLLTGLEKYND